MLRFGQTTYRYSAWPPSHPRTFCAPPLLPPLTIWLLFRLSVRTNPVQKSTSREQSGHYVWPAAPALSAYLADRRESLLLPHGGGGSGSGVRCLELGAGCGLAGLVAAHLRGTSAVVFTDHDPGQHTIPCRIFILCA